ncbi:MAG: hypothetical protein JSS86_24665 [Cyanobacteria bacterium SZAS LIN-2]|nr:hypothetical protein [Cyanobacteria bacterium SZAS LIN-3]MBS1999551.1 hypothetical protein [Cyanobacteria bacterium SZAS LIN-2]
MAEQDLDNDERRLRNVKITMAISLFVVFVGGALAVKNVLKSGPSPTEKLAAKVLADKHRQAAEDIRQPINLSVDNVLVGTTRELKRLGATDEEIQKANNSRYEVLTSQSLNYAEVMRSLIAEPGWLTTRFRVGGPGEPFKFPDKVNIGAISINGGKPVFATGLIEAPAGKSVCLYYSWAANAFPQILRKFGPSDLTGLEVVCKRTDRVLAEIKDWTRLRELSFFNSLLKSLPALEIFDESIIADGQLPDLERFAGLRSLGLCGHDITGRAIVAMPLLKRLEVLKVKRIKDVDTLIQFLPAFPNIKELWLVDQGITDEQVDTLSNMPALETLHITRSFLTPASLAYFRQMPGLKHLILDRNGWSAADKQKFQTGLSGCLCEFEPMIDTTFWQVFTDPSAGASRPAGRSTSSEL